MPLRPTCLFDRLTAHVLGDGTTMTELQVKVALELLKIHEARRRDTAARKAARKKKPTHAEALLLLDGEEEG